MANEKNKVPGVPAASHAHGAVGPKTAGMRPFDAAGQYGRQETPEDAARLPGLSPEMYKAHVTDYQAKLAEYNAKARGQSAESTTASTPDAANVKRGTR